MSESLHDVAPEALAGSPVVAIELGGAGAEPGGDTGFEVHEREFTVKARTQRQMVVKRFFRHRLAMISLGVLFVIVIVSFVGAAFWKYSYTESADVLNGGRPTLDVIPFLDGDGLAFGEHPMGQDNIGRDYLALTLRGSQRSLLIALTAGLVGTLLGTVVGALSGYYRGWVDNGLMRCVDVLLTIPTLLVAAVLGRRAKDIPVLNSVFGSKSIFLLALVIAFVSWLSISRVVRGEFLSLREKEYVEAARAIGAKNRRIITKHLLPNVAGTIIVSATLLVSSAILLETALSFLGFGVQPDGLVARQAGLAVPHRVQHQAVAVLVAGHLHHPHRAVDQLHRRRLAGRLRSAPDAGAAMIAFPGHAGRCWPLPRWRSVARTGARTLHD